MLVCVYYRVAAADAPRALLAARAAQAALQERFRPTLGSLAARVLIRRDDAAGPATRSDGDGDRGHSAAAEPAVLEATLMETYETSPALDSDRQASSRAHADLAQDAFLHALAPAAGALATLTRGRRHVEVFLPCA